jgi:hypothetical protein
MNTGTNYKDVYSASPQQKKYIEILSIDLRLIRKQMYDSISTILGREVKDIDTLKISEASRVIEEFKRRKNE